jgi:Uma2 family endonuclease
VEVERPTVAIVGGGMAGLAAAYALRDLADVVVLEASSRVGGKVRVSEVGGIAVDEGADALIRRVPYGIDLAQAAGFGDELVSPATGAAFVRARGRLRPLPTGTFLGVPADLTSLARSEVLSAHGLARVPLDLVAPGDPVVEDIAVGELVGRRLGREVVELLDGRVLVTPSPTWRHQNVVGELGFALRMALPPEFKAFWAPLDVRFSNRMLLQPDVLVVRRTDLTGERIDRPPLMVAEVLSPSTRGRDQVLKRSAYERAGVPSYWLLDPDVPSLTVLELVDGSYVEIAHVNGDQPWTAERPFPVTIVPAALLR